MSQSASTDHVLVKKHFHTVLFLISMADPALKHFLVTDMSCHLESTPQSANMHVHIHGSTLLHLVLQSQPHLITEPLQIMTHCHDDGAYTKRPEMRSWDGQN